MNQNTDLKKYSLLAKHATLSRIFNREADQIFCSPKAEHYRARITLRTGKDGFLGYFKPKTHTHVPIKEDPLASNTINSVLRKLNPAPCSLHQVEFRTDGYKVVLSIKERQNPPKEKILQWAQKYVDGIALNGKTIWGKTDLEISSGGLNHFVSPSSFYQINLELNTIMVDRVLQILKPLKPERILDLYSGYGNLSFPFAQMGIPIELIESNPSSINDAKTNLKRFGLSAKLTLQDASKFKAGQSIFDVALLDPPRSGSGNALQQVALTRPRAILYISCNPKSFFKESKILSGYSLERWELFDMFPQTPHVESLALFLRKS